MTSSEIRKQFIDFFRGKQHVIVPSSPVVPFDDPTLLFTNAGMNQFKPIFLGQHAADVDRWQGATPGLPTRAANTQKCIRAGGKHNDLDDVGKDTYHHTFFEMLGNWSFGDYFKKEAIQWAWELLTKVWGIPKERLHATYFGGTEPRSSDRANLRHHEETRIEETPRGPKSSVREAESLPPDHESRDLWISLTDIHPSHVHPGSMKDNFWEMGDTGPCGPCSEIHIDLTPDCSGGQLVNAGDARVMEIWNLVFIQFNRGSDGKLTPLPAKHVDTGMGFERLCSVLQGLAAGRLGRFTNYDTDVFTPIFEAIHRRTGAPAYMGTLPASQASACATSPDCGVQHAPEPSRGLKPAARDQVMMDVSYRVIADHLRALTFAITDGAMPSNEGRGFVLRRILRRAVRFGRQYLNMHEPFICDLVEPLVAHMGDAFPELRTAHGGKNVKHLIEIIRDEEASFLKTLDRGMKLFDEAAERALQSRNPKGADVTIADRGSDHSVISGEDAFRLHDTYGFPIDLTQQMAEERGLTVDIAEYERLMEEARKKARAIDSKADSADNQKLREQAIQGARDEARADDSHKYGDDLKLNTSLTGTWNYRPPDRNAHVGQHVLLRLGRTPFYAEQGGQVSDIGEIRTANGAVRVTRVVRDTSWLGDVILHEGVVEHGWIQGQGEECEAIVNRNYRHPIQQNHTATHLLNWALREALCSPEERVQPHVQQKGSLVDAEKTRFDFSHNKALSEEDLGRIEDYVRMQIRADHPVYAAPREEDFTDQAVARKVSTLRAVFGEKYPEKVRVVSIGVPVTEADARAAGKGDWLLKSPANPEWMHYSVEFCGGTHVKRTGEIEDFVIVSEEAVAKGVRRVVGMTAQTARDARARAATLRDQVAALWDAPEADFHARLVAAQKKFSDAVIPVLDRHKIREQLDQLAEKAKKLEKQKVAASGDAVMQRVAELLANAECGMRNAELSASKAMKPEGPASAHSAFSIQHSAFTTSGVTIIVAEVPPAPPDALRGAIDWIRQKTDASAVLLACVGEEGKVTLMAGMSKTVVERGIKAGDLIKEVTPLVGGKGGGRPDLAQGGGTDATGLPKVLEASVSWLAERLH
ncbi:MAG: alanine--tRNA ligase [Phycisphaerales bacterium]|nr:alanine--tRNA ligase [Phycisphaerales bacterium]